MQQIQDGRKEFVLKGHKYQVLPFNPSSFGMFALKIAAMVSGPLLTLLKNGEDADISEIDAQQLQASLMEVVKNLSEEEVIRIFSETQRDGKHLGMTGNYDAAYKGNWVEWFMALKEILKANGFFDFLSMSVGTETEEAK